MHCIHCLSGSNKSLAPNGKVGLCAVVRGLENTNNCAAGKSAEAPSNDDKAKGQLFAAWQSLQSFVHRSSRVFRVSYPCPHGDFKISCLCAPPGQF